MWTDSIKKIKGKRDRWDICLFAAALGFYLFFPFYDGPVWCKDSLSYATMDITREPLYPVFLWVFRKFFGEEGYLFAAVTAQSILAAYASWKLAMTVKEHNGGSRALALLSAGFQFGVTLLCRFVAIRGSSYINSIMTEGLGLSLYVLFAVQLYRYIAGEKGTGERRGKNLAGTVFFAFLLVNLRKQMLITLCLMAAVFILYDLFKERNIRRLLLLLGLTAGVFAACRFTDRLYNYCVRGVWMEHAGNATGVLCTLVYTSGEEDAALFEDGELKGLYEEILAEADRQGLRMAYAPQGWMDLASHYADCYDAIGYGIINPAVQGYIEERYGYTGIDRMLEFDKYCSAMAKTLLGQEKGDLIRVYAANTWKGFINSIARAGRYLNLYAAAAYALYLGLYARCLRKNRGAARQGGIAVAAMAEIVMGGIAVNALAVGAMIFCQPRYMIYNMGLFYTALSVLVYDAAKMRRGEAGKMRPEWKMEAEGSGAGHEGKNSR